MSNPSPGVVLLSVRNWFGAGRLPRAFKRAGFGVTTLSYPSLLINRSRYIDRALFLPDQGSDTAVVDALLQVLEQQAPALVIPTDDASVEWLHAAAASAVSQRPSNPALVTLLRDSLGDFAHLATVRARKAMATFAERAGVRTPHQACVRDRAEALAFAEQHGFPVVLKAEESFAGLGVSICRDAAAIESALSRYEGAGSLRDGLLAQSFVSGPTAMRLVAAFRGRVLAGLSAVKVETHPGSTGPSSVVEFVDVPEMARAAERLVAALGFSGFASLDFVLDEAGAQLIEYNPRPTPICHLGELLGLDLCLALRRAIAGEEAREGVPPNLPRKVVLFPQEWVRNAESPHFAGAYHDVPWDEPDLCEAYVALARSQMRFGEFRREEERRDRVRAMIAGLEQALPARATGER